METPDAAPGDRQRVPARPAWHVGGMCRRVGVSACRRLAAQLLLFGLAAAMRETGEKGGKLRRLVIHEKRMQTG
jgi:hypothetical protein